MINLLLFFEETKLKEHLNRASGEYIVVTPSPGHADAARKLFDSEQRFDVVTISHFMKFQYSELFDEGTLDKKKTKSELLLLLGSLWRLIEPNSRFEFFERSFNLLTDFRAFSMNDDVLETILENYDEGLRKATLWCHKILKELDIIDEHCAYFKLSEKLRQGDLPILYENEKKIVFYGFDFLTPSQIDLLNALSIRNEVYVPFFKDVFDKSSDLDWIKWISKLDSEIVVLDEKPLRNKEIPTVYYPKGNLAKSLSQLEIKSKNILLCTKRSEDVYISEVPSTIHQFKSALNIFEKEIREVEQDLLSVLKLGVVGIAEMKTFIDSKMNLAVKEKKFKLIKILSLIKETFENWKDLSDKNIEISHFEAKLFLSIIELDVPRNSIINKVQSDYKILTLKDLNQIEVGSDYIFCISSQYGPIKSSVVDYSEDVQKYLASIGPIRRSDFEFEIFKQRLLTKFLSYKVTLVLEKGLMEQDVGWSDILSELTLRDERFSLDNKRKNNFSYFENKNENYSLKNYSASKLQSYIDCPQKFWFHYILKQRVDLVFEKRLSFLELGRVEHAVIEKYVANNDSYIADIHIALINKELAKFNKDYDDQFMLVDYQREVVLLTQDIIQELYTLKSKFNLDLDFEKKLNHKKEINGSIDCYGESSGLNLIFDFKRGGSSIPSKKGLLEFDKIQLWFYLRHIQFLKPDFMKKDFIWGYINLSDLDESLLFCSNKELVKELKSLDLKIFNKLYVFDDSFLEQSEEYKIFEDEVISLISSDSSFVAKPKSEMVCSYCEMNLICRRSH